MKKAYYDSLHNYSIYDPYTFIRFNDNFSKIARENIIDINSLINSLNEPQNVKRTSLNLLKQYVLEQKKKHKRIIIRDKELFVQTAIYYSRILNGLPSIKPKKLHKNLKDWFVNDYLSKNPEVKKMFFKNKMNPQNLLYATLSKTIISNNPDLELDAYRISYILGNALKRHGYFTSKPQLSFAVLTYHIAKKNNIQVNTKKLSKIFNTSDAYIIVLESRNRNKLEQIYKDMSEDDIKLLLESIENIMKKINVD